MVLSRGANLEHRKGAKSEYRNQLGDTVAEGQGIYAALESVWQAKRECRAELAKKRAVRFLAFRAVRPTRR